MKAGGEIKASSPTRKATYNKTCVKRPFSKGPKIGFQDQLLLNAGQKYCRMLLWEHSAILSTYIIVLKLPFVIKTFVLSVFEWPFYTGFTREAAGWSLTGGTVLCPRARHINPN